MPAAPWTPDVLARVDDDYDSNYASDGHSRYGAYLAQHPHDFHEYGEPDNPLPAAEFAAVAWRVATSPIMSPGYARLRPDLARITATISENDSELLVLTIHMPLRHDTLAARLPAGLRDWQPNRGWGEERGPYDALEAPDDGRPVLMASVAVRFTVDQGALITPEHVRGPGLVDDAQRAVRALVEQINRRGGPVVEQLHKHATRGR